MLNSRELKTWRQTLTELQRRLDGEVAELRAELAHSAADQSAEEEPSHHRDDLGKEKASEAVLVGMVENEAFLRQEVKDALGRIDAGEFGICETCRKAIPKARLAQIPYARCVPCAET